MTEAQRRARKRIYDRNYRFSKMSKPRQRVAIAKDVLKLLDSQKLTAERGTYLESHSDVPPEMEREFKLTGEVKLKEFVSAPSVTCNVCAIGAVFTAAVLERGIDGERNCLARSNSGWSDGGQVYFEGTNREAMVQALEPYFTPKQLDQLETYFEDESNPDCNYDSWEDEDDETPPGQYDDDEDALRAAMNHIIKTGGREVAP